MERLIARGVAAIALSLTFAGSSLLAQDGQDAPAKQAPAAEEGSADKQGKGQGDDQEARNAQFLKQMNGVKLVGKFTVLGKDQDKLPTEEYEIRSVQKLPAGDKWLFNARIKYGKLDVTLPMALDVVWSGDTPVITLTDVTIPTLGTFSCRVLIYNGKYAGTWTHGAAGGHMFGVLEPLADDAAPAEQEETEREAAKGSSK